MLFICEWPYAQIYAKMKPNYDAITKYCHVFRNHYDISDSWGSVDSIIQFYGENNEQFSKYNGIKY
jgi:hypothetical protein